jgi:murein DD-endopeptidase MepM/ murein hydrolase activator NlpD
MKESTANRVYAGFLAGDSHMTAESNPRCGAAAAGRCRGTAGLGLSLALLLAAPLAGCGGGPRLAALPTPPDPPPIPDRKPITPDWVGLAGGAMLGAETAGGALAAAARSAGEKIDPSAAAPVTTVSLEPLPPAKVAASTPAAIAQPPAAPAVARYRVALGDTVYGVSRRHGVPIRDVIETNRLAPPFTLKVGQELLIPSPRRHVVQPGDTIYGIARGYGLDVTELVRLNGIEAPYIISPGQDLALPRGPTTAAPEASLVASAATGSDAPSAAAGATQTAALPSTVPPEPEIPAAIPTPPPRSGGKFLWPLRGQVIDAYGSKDGGLHNDGINIAAPRGAAVHAAENGVVAYAGNELRGFGNLILIKHEGGWVTAYAHNEEILVRRGAVVSRGQVIARTGNSGNVSRPQLHFEIRKGSRAVDPLRFLGPPLNALAQE